MTDRENPNKRESQITLTRFQDMAELSNSDRCKHRSTTEKLLIQIILFCLLVLLGLVIYLVITICCSKGNENAGQKSAFDNYSSLVSNHSVKDVCLTKGCIKAASVILERLDESIDPCDDFYKFACNTHDENIIIPDDKTSISQFSIINDPLQERLRLIVQENVSKCDSFSTLMVKNLYKSCMNTERVEELGLEPLREVLQKVGGWPVVSGASWDSSTFSWTEAVYKNRKLGFFVNYLIYCYVGIDLKNSSWRIITLDQPSLGMPSRKHLLKGLNDSDVQAYHEYQVSLAVMLGAERQAAQSEMKEALLFEMQIANISLDQEERRNYTALYNKLTIRDLEKMVPNIPWLNYIRKVLSTDENITEDEPINVRVPQYVQKLGQLFRTTPPRVVANYFMWRLAASTVDYLSDKVRDLQLKYSKKLTGRGTRAPRWGYCMGEVSASLDLAIGSLYVQKFFKGNAKAEADEMVSYIRAEFDKILLSVDWMDEKTRFRALKKSKAIIAQIAYPRELLVEEKLSEFYKDLHISDGDLLENTRNLTIFFKNYYFGLLREKVDKTHWSLYGAAAVVNAFYSAIDNSIVFPAGILQGTFFNADRPKYLNYGAIGFVIGHEITHGFDDRGRQFDENGDLKNWWEENSQKKLIEKSKCIIWQYGNFTEPQLGININGINTQGENIADNGGVTEAYRAYKQWVADHKEEPHLPGVPYTPNQLFWISTAHVWCSKSRPESMKLNVITGYHSPPKFRTNGPMLNIPEFSSDWNCPLGSKMNPVNKCTVW